MVFFGALFGIMFIAVLCGMFYNLGVESQKVKNAEILSEYLKIQHENKNRDNIGNV